MLELVISGGQSGVDQAGWRAAKAAGIATGGWMPKGFRTEDGNRPDFAELYGAVEHPSRDWLGRTQANIYKADMTLCLGSMDSPGSKAAWRIFKEKVSEFKPVNRYVAQGKKVPLYYFTDNSDWIGYSMREDTRALTVVGVADLIRKRGIKILNIAGNRESSSPGIGEEAEAFLGKVFAKLIEWEA